MALIRFCFYHNNCNYSHIFAFIKTRLPNIFMNFWLLESAVALHQFLCGLGGTSYMTSLWRDKMQIMTLKTAAILTLTSMGLSSLACAGEQSDLSSVPTSTSFVKADLNEDALLTRDEFKAFVALEAEAGQEHFARINQDGTEDLHFSGKDIDGDGLLTTDELAYKVILPGETLEKTPQYGSDKASEPTDEETVDIEPPTEG